jgi:DEAD/DEAH box helicase domain-containing protein
MAFRSCPRQRQLCLYHASATLREQEEKAINTIYFDLETQRTFDEVGGRHNVRKLRLAAAVTYNTATAAYHRYTEGRVKELVEELQSADLVVGYNVLEFDYEVLRGYRSVRLEQPPTLDMMQDLARSLGFRLSLEAVATATLQVGKSADGLQAVRWYRQGLIDQVLDYCQQDVEITKRVHEFGKQNRFVYYWDKQYQRQMVPVNW